MNKIIIFGVLLMVALSKRFLVTIDPNDRFCFYDVFGNLIL